MSNHLISFAPLESIPLAASRRSTDGDLLKNSSLRSSGISSRIIPVGSRRSWGTWISRCDDRQHQDSFTGCQKFRSHTDTRVQHQAHVEPSIFDAAPRDRGLRGKGQIVGRSKFDRFHRGFRVLTRDWRPTSSGLVRPVASSRAFGSLSPFLGRTPRGDLFPANAFPPPCLPPPVAFYHLPPCVPRPSDRPLVALFESIFPPDFSTEISRWLPADRHCL